MTVTTWIVQSNVEPESTSLRFLRRACAARDRPIVEVTVVPRMKTVPDLPPIVGPVVFHGRETLIHRAFEDPRWQHGVFFDPVRFQHKAYHAAYGNRLLNADATVVSWTSFLEEARKPEELVFLRPTDDSKRFTGLVLRFADCRPLYEALRSTKRSIDPTDEVVVGEPREIDAEWRLFIVEGKVITGSMYRPSGDPYLPQELIDFAGELTEPWEPAPIFVLDVARTDGEWKVVECNCFNGSRFYCADVEKIVLAVSEYQERRVAIS